MFAIWDFVFYSPAWSIFGATLCRTAKVFEARPSFCNLTTACLASITEWHNANHIIGLINNPALFFLRNRYRKETRAGTFVF
jgi:hypothetical protein